MQITINDIVGTTELKTKLITGSEQRHNTVQWAHVCEMPDPTEWLGPNDLLMTTGLGIPKDRHQQMMYIQRLKEAGLAGLMIGENMSAPDDLSALFDTAAQYQFPVMTTHYGVPFAAVTKMIMDSKNQFEFERNRTISRLYEHARKGLSGPNTQALIQSLSQAVNADVYLTNLQHHNSIFGQSLQLPQKISEALKQCQKQSLHENSLVTKIKYDENSWLYVLETTFSGCYLLIHGKTLDYSLIHHITSILSIELERKFQDFQRNLDQGNRLIQDAMQQKLSVHQLQTQLQHYGLHPQTACVILADLQLDLEQEWSTFLFLNQLYVLLVPYKKQYLLVSNESETTLLNPALRYAGISNKVGYLDRFQAAVQEAKLAYRHVEREHPVQHYRGIADRLPWLPHDIDEAKQISERFLGPLIQYDAKKEGHYLTTLKTFLEHDCSWERAAKALFIHKQTLVYRMNKIQELLGRNIMKTEDVSILWLALKCHDIFKP